MCGHPRYKSGPANELQMLAWVAGLNFDEDKVIKFSWVIQHESSIMIHVYEACVLS